MELATGVVPAKPDLGRMRRDRTGRVREAMREQGLDAVVLLGNTNVVYATGAIWPLSDASRTNFEQPVAVVLADDELPHLFSPNRADARMQADLPDDHVHGPAHLDFDEGVETFLPQLYDLVGEGAAVAIDAEAAAAAGKSVHLGKRQPGEAEVTARDFHGRKHAERVVEPVAAGHADLEGERFAQDVGGDRRAVGVERVAQGADVSPLPFTKATTVRPAAWPIRRSRCSLSKGMIAVPPGSRPCICPVRR